MINSTKKWLEKGSSKKKTTENK